MSQNIAVENMPDVNTTPAKPGDSRCSNGLVTVTVTPDEYMRDAAEKVRQLFPHAQHIIEKSTRTGLEGEEYESEVQRYRVTYSTIAEAQEVYRSIGGLASIRIEAPITLNEEELEVLAEYHSHELVSLNWRMHVCDVKGDGYMFGYHNRRLDEIERVLGQEAVQRIVDETIKKATRRASYTEGAAREDSKRRLTRSTPRRRGKSALKRPAFGRTRKGSVPLAAKAQRPKAPGNDRS